MSSRIEQPPIRAGQPRRTEDSDTRQGIQRHDPEFHRKKKDDKEEGGFKDPYEDLADVSVPALKNFLIGLLDRVDTPQEPSMGPVQDSARPAASPQTAAAVNAYQAGARRGASSSPPPPPSSQVVKPASALDQAAAGLDRVMVIELIRELDRLHVEGVTGIALEKGEGFLESIRAGINRARGL